MAYDKTTFLSGLTMGLIGKGDPTFTGSGKMLYNGVALPALPEWDKEAYPYAVIEYTEDELGWGGAGVARLRALKKPWKVSGGYVVPGESLEQFFSIVTTSMTDWGSSSTGNISQTAKLDDVIWTNHDILNNDGTVYLTASDPVVVEDTFTKGYHVGAELRRKRALPVAYLYNGVELPDINTVRDKEKYPYAFIGGPSIAGMYFLYTFNTQPYYSDALSEYQSSGLYIPAGTGWHYFTKASGSDAWQHSSEGVETIVRRIGPADGWLWVSHDVVVNGEVVCATYDPVPVYE